MNKAYIAARRRPIPHNMRGWRNPPSLSTALQSTARTGAHSFAYRTQYNLQLITTFWRLNLAWTRYCIIRGSGSCMTRMRINLSHTLPWPPHCLRTYVPTVVYCTSSASHSNLRGHGFKSLRQDGRDCTITSTVENHWIGMKK